MLCNNTVLSGNEMYIANKILDLNIFEICAINILREIECYTCVYNKVSVLTS